ncbi:MAG TPA: phosphoribosylformylglycinamidine synthase II, partial [Rhodospirillaceae bacterium]|nr:phosphoribosylformylglycinamidine synthase II [Rhodospirillaceae bacterium]
RRTGDFVRSLIEAGQITACHDLSDGGLLVALAEMALSGDLGAQITLPDGVHATAFLFGEDQARYLVTTGDAAQLATAARDTGVPALVLGTCGGGEIAVDGHGGISLVDLRTIHEGWMPAFMAAPGA